MNLTIRDTSAGPVAILNRESPPVGTLQEALDLMAHADSLGARSIIVRQEHLVADFYDLKTRLAGDILQKFTNYGFRLAVVGAFSDLQSQSLRDFIYESNRRGQFLFLPSEAAVLSRWECEI